MIKLLKELFQTFNRRKRNTEETWRKPDQSDEKWEKEVYKFLADTADNRLKKVKDTYPATEDSWEFKKFGSVTEIPYRPKFSKAEMDLIKRGFVPSQMEDKWFSYFNLDTLLVFRSWTGQPAYSIRFSEQRPGEYHGMGYCSDEFFSVPNEGDYHADLLSYLIDVLLLGKKRALPTSL